MNVGRHDPKAEAGDTAKHAEKRAEPTGKKGHAGAQKEKTPKLTQTCYTKLNFHPLVTKDLQHTFEVGRPMGSESAKIRV